jgi:3-deoxy-D-manno-octulosonic-acid transferase
VLAEGEMWPNFVRIANTRGVKLTIINGRMSPRSAGRFSRVGWLVRNLFQRIDLIAAQTEDYAANYRLLGAKHVVVTGSVKYDGAQNDRNNPRTREMRELFCIHPGQLVWVAGSTQAPEEEIILSIYREAMITHPNLRLIIVPRQKDRFGEVARILDQSGLPYVRRSEIDHSPLTTHHSPLTTHHSPIILVDTIGELSAIWGLTDVAFVGGSLDGKRGGQNMIEPAAYGAAVVFGPHTWNFKDMVARLLEHESAVQVQDAEELKRETLRLLGDAAARSRSGRSAQAFVASQQGATERTLDALDELVDARRSAQAA